MGFPPASYSPPGLPAHSNRVLKKYFEETFHISQNFLYSLRRSDYQRPKRPGLPPSQGQKGVSSAGMGARKDVTGWGWGDKGWGQRGRGLGGDRGGFTWQTQEVGEDHKPPASELERLPLDLLATGAQGSSCPPAQGRPRPRSESFPAAFSTGTKGRRDVGALCLSHPFYLGCGAHTLQERPTPGPQGKRLHRFQTAAPRPHPGLAAPCRAPQRRGTEVLSVAQRVVGRGSLPWGILWGPE